MRLLGVLRNAGDICCFSLPSILSPSFHFSIGTHKFSILSVGGLGGADLFPSISHPPPLPPSDWFKTTAKWTWLQPWPGTGRKVFVSAGTAEEDVSPELQRRTGLRMEPAEKSREQRQKPNPGLHLCPSFQPYCIFYAWDFQLCEQITSFLFLYLKLILTERRLTRGMFWHSRKQCVSVQQGLKRLQRWAGAGM